MRLETCTRSDYLHILENYALFWGSDRARHVHHSIVLEEFGDTAFVVRHGDVLCGYLFGFFAQTGRYFYIHLVAVRDSHRGQGIASRLYAHVEKLARDAGRDTIKAITTMDNEASISYHLALGFEAVGSAERDGLRFEPDYSGRGRDRVVFVKSLNRDGS